MAISERLEGKTIAVLTANEGVEQIELTRPVEALRAEGAVVELLAPIDGTVQGFDHLDKADSFEADRRVADVDASTYDGVLLPGGVANPDLLRMDDHAVTFIRRAFEVGLPIAAICHAPWALIEAGVVDGLTVTSFPSLRTDLENAGASWVDEEVVTDEGVVTSRRPDDLDAFCAKIVEEYAEGVHPRSVVAVEENA